MFIPANCCNRITDLGMKWIGRELCKSYTESSHSKRDLGRYHDLTQFVASMFDHTPSYIRDIVEHIVESEDSEVYGEHFLMLVSTVWMKAG